MIGDVNLFLIPANDDEDQGTSEKGKLQAEVEIMIAENAFRRGGRGREATLLMLKYGTAKTHLLIFKV